MRGRKWPFICALFLATSDVPRGALGWGIRPYSWAMRRTNAARKRARVICFDNEKDTSWAPAQLKQPASSPQPTPENQQRKYHRMVGAEELNQIKEDVDMVALIESCNLDKFRRTGPDRATACCPFHDDHNPSFSVDGQRGMYKCFSCGAAGDVFNFVRQYHKENTHEEMPFMEAVQRVQGFQLGGDIEITQPSTMMESWSSSPRMTKEQKEKQERIYAMNQEAAAFYAMCLTLPFAGGARHYLQSRGFKSPAAVTAFALGYAPDVYFANRYLPKDQKSLVHHLEDRGFNASEILASGLATQVRRKNPKEEHNKQTTDPRNTTTAISNKTDAEEVNISSLMDRFRGRLIVPIFDRTGQKVAGFGGRIIPVYDEEAPQNSGFKTPKYLNSPETAVFQKKNILFAQHMVIDECRRQSTKSKGSSNSQSAAARSDLLMVEGYMDVLALWDIGIKTAVATMGTAVSLDQVNAAAKMARTNGGRVVLCLDNDEAGYTAVERLCTGGFLRKASGSFAVQFCIATLPSGMKDPGDYIEHSSKKRKPLKKIADKFWAEVVEPAQDWSEWFLQRILDRYDGTATRGNAGSFGDVFQRVTDFLSTFPSPADRTKSAYEMAGKLAELMAKDNNSTSISKAAHMQLESDLIDSASRLANIRDTQKRRAEQSSSDIQSSLTPYAPSSVAQDRANEIEKLSSKALEKLTGGSGPREDTIGSKTEGNNPPRRKIEQVDQQKGRPRRRMYRPLTEKEPPSLTPHFAGFQFENPTDADWLGIPRNKAKAGNSILTLGDLHSYDEPNRFSRKGKSKPVYFNSNTYHGNHFVSSDAVMAGYSDKLRVSDFSSTMDKGVSSLVKQDVDRNLIAAEDALLYSLVSHYPESPTAVKDVLQASASVGPDVMIQWSSPHREWLFNRLQEDDVLEECDVARCDPTALRSVLSNRDDVPHGAFSEMEMKAAAAQEGPNWRPDQDGSGGETTTKPSRGTLDRFFTKDLSLPETASNISSSDSNDLLVQSEKASLAAQEHLMSLLLASSSRQIQTIKNDLNSVSLMLQGHASNARGSLGSTHEALDGLDRSDLITNSSASIIDMNTTTTKRVESVSPASSIALLERSEIHPDPGALQSSQNMSLDDMQQHCKDLLSHFQSAIERHNQLDRSAKRITERLMRFGGSASETVEGRISIPLQKRLARELDDHLNQFDGRSISSEIDNDDRLGKRGVTETSVEDELANIENNWGDWCDDDFIWSPEKTNRNRGHMVSLTTNIDDLEDEEESETLDEALARIDDEWKNWMG